MTFNLTYRQGSFLQAHAYVTLVGAIGRAGLILKMVGCYGLAIDEDGRPLLAEPEIVARLDGIAAALRPTR